MMWSHLWLESGAEVLKYICQTSKGPITCGGLARLAGLACFAEMTVHPGIT